VSRGLEYWSHGVLENPMLHHSSTPLGIRLSVYTMPRAKSRLPPTTYAGENFNLSAQTLECGRVEPIRTPSEQRPKTKTNN
jgi:hypothetical protein